MRVFDLYSKRQKRLRGEGQDVFQYEELPRELRVQIVHIIHDTIGRDDETGAFTFVVDTLCREYGLFVLPPTLSRGLTGRPQELIDFFLQEANTERALDVIEVSFRFIDRVTRGFNFRHRSDANEAATAAIDELNFRFKEHGVGFQYVDGEIIRLDSELIHSEVVKPALRLLNTKDFEGAQEEFLSAFEHYRHGNNKEALNDCLKAFESTMKAICAKRGWAFNPNDPASKLIQVLFDNALIAPFWQTQLTSLKSLLESGVPTGRNKLSGHGQGATPVAVPDHIVAYMIHMTASTLVFLTTAEAQLP